MKIFRKIADSIFGDSLKYKAWINNVELSDLPENNIFKQMEAFLKRNNYASPEAGEDMRESLKKVLFCMEDMEKKSKEK